MEYKLLYKKWSKFIEGLKLKFFENIESLVSLKGLQF